MATISAASTHARASSLDPADFLPAATPTVFRLNEHIPLETLAENVIDPRSPRYNKPYSIEEIRSLSGPTDQEFESAEMSLQAQGYKIVSFDQTRLFIVAIGPPRANFASLTIEGAPTRQVPPHPIRLNFKPSVIAQQYGIDILQKNNLLGLNQHVAIASYGGFSMDNILYYFKAMGLKKYPHVDRVDVNGPLPYLAGTASETESDAELVGSVAPEADIHIFSSAVNSFVGETQLFSKILDDPRIKVVSYSWTNCERVYNSEVRINLEKIFARAVAQGVNIFVSSGDDGPWCSKAQRGGNLDISVYAGLTYSVTVGGTELASTPNGFSEQAWAQTGGGESAVNPRPWWQKNLPIEGANKLVPDVSFNAGGLSAQPVYVSTGNNQAAWIEMSGTSIATPQWAALIALINQARSNQMKAPLTFLPPIIYGFNDVQNKNSFNDIVEGGEGAFYAGFGWDYLTGLGSPKAGGLLSELIK